MKILYINSLYAPHIRGGAEISLKLLVEGMQRKGAEVAVLSMVPEGGLMEEKVEGVKVYRAGLRNSYWPYDKEHKPAHKRLLWHLKDRSNPDMGKYVRQVLEKEKPDVVSCHNLAGWSIAVWEEISRLHIPIVQVLHDMYLLCPNSNMYKGDTVCDGICLECKLLRANHKSKSRLVSAVVGISKSILQRFIDHGYFSNAKTYVIHNTRDIPFPGLPRKRQPGSPLRIGYLGTLSKIKGIEWLMESFKSRTYQGALKIAGKGKADYEAELKGKAGDKDIHFIGYVKPAEFFEQIDVLVVPSLWEEPLGMVAIEALAHHIPVIANHAGGLKETVKENGNGLFCRASAPGSLNEALEKLSNDVALYNRLSASARDSVADILSEERMLKAYQQVMEEVSQKALKETK
ncbi:glycosyltransferase family 4 protein [Echinicola sediminis]